MLLWPRQGYESEWASYALDEIGPKEAMVVGKAAKRLERTLHVDVSAIGRTRTITFRCLSLPPPCVTITTELVLTCGGQ
jgi:hypothetical protein